MGLLSAAAAPEEVGREVHLWASAALEVVVPAVPEAAALGGRTVNLQEWQECPQPTGL